MGLVILGGICAVLAGLYFLPVGLTLRYDSDGLMLRYLLGWIPVMPKPLLGEVQPATKGKRSAAGPKKKKAKGGGPITSFLHQLEDTFRLWLLLRDRLWVRQLRVELVMAGEDPCDLALGYVGASAAVDALLVQLERFFDIRKKKINISCDFDATQTTLLLRADAVICLGHLLRLLLRREMQNAQKMTHQTNSDKGGASHE